MDNLISLNKNLKLYFFCIFLYIENVIVCCSNADNLECYATLFTRKQESTRIYLQVLQDNGQGQRGCNTCFRWFLQS